MFTKNLVIPGVLFLSMEEENEQLNREGSVKFLCSFVICCTSTGISAEWVGSIIVN